MFIKYCIREQILISADEYTVNATKATRDAIFRKYLFKIVKIAGINSSKQSDAICVKIQSIQIIDNIILRKTADMKIKVMITLTVLRLLPDQYYEGKVVKISSKGIVVSFINGLLEGTLTLKHLHKDTIYSEENNKWILATGNRNTQGYQWKIGSDVRFRIAYTLWDCVQPVQNSQELQMSDFVFLRADQAGLGPAEWWL